MHDTTEPANIYTNDLDARAATLYTWITAQLATGRRIQVTTWAQSRIYSAPQQFQLSGRSVYAQRGRHWDCIDHAKVNTL